MDTILIVDDDKDIRQTLRTMLEEYDFMVIEAAHGKRLFDIIEQHPADLILLDIDLPDGSGIDFLSHIRNHTNAPVMIVSGHCDKKRTLDGYENGADDYLEKPFEPEILIAKVKANLRRYKSRGDGFHNDIIKFGEWIFDRSRHQIFDHAGQSADLTAQETALLSVLIDHMGRVVKRDELCEAVREGSYVPTPRAIDVKITRIRKKIEENAARPQILKTVRGVGYIIDQGDTA